MAPTNPLDDLRRRIGHGTTPVAFAALAEEHRRAGRLDEAVTVCREGLERYPTYASARVTLGRALLDLGDIEGARVELETAVAQAPDNLAAARALDMLRMRTGDEAAPSSASAPASATTLMQEEPASTVATGEDHAAPVTWMTDLLREPPELTPPAETPPAEPASVETMSAQTVPAETLPGETLPVENGAADLPGVSPEAADEPASPWASGAMSWLVPASDGPAEDDGATTPFASEQPDDIEPAHSAFAAWNAPVNDTVADLSDQTAVAPPEASSDASLESLQSLLDTIRARRALLADTTSDVD